MNKLFEDDRIKGKITKDGITVSIEYKRGDIQQGVNKKTGESWSREFFVHYGYISGIEAPDGDSLDVFLKPKALEGKPIFIVHNLTPDGKSFDEDKVFMGFDNEQQALVVWKKHIHRPDTMFGGVCQFTVEEFKKILSSIKNNKGIIAKPENYYYLKNKGFLPENLTSLAFNEYLISDESSHIIPSNRYPNHPMGRFRQFIGTPLSSEAERFNHGVQDNPNSEDNFKTDIGANLTHGFEDQLNIGDYGQNQGLVLDHDNPNYSSYSNEHKDNIIKIDFHKEKELETGIPFDYEIRDSEWVVNDLDDVILKQSNSIVEYVVSHLKYISANKYNKGLLFKTVVSFIIEQQGNIYLKFGKSLNSNEMREIISKAIKQYIGDSDEVYRSS